MKITRRQLRKLIREHVYVIKENEEIKKAVSTEVDSSQNRIEGAVSILANLLKNKPEEEKEEFAQKFQIYFGKCLDKEPAMKKFGGAKIMTSGGIDGGRTELGIVNTAIITGMVGILASTLEQFNIPQASSMIRVAAGGLPGADQSFTDRLGSLASAAMNLNSNSMTQTVAGFLNALDCAVKTMGRES
jgi:hypothetical protein